MARLRAPIDPYCRLNGAGAQVRPTDSDTDLAALAGYARGLGVQVWRYADGKLALTSKRYGRELGTEDVPLVFGGEGDTVGMAASKAFNALHEQSYTLQRAVRGAESVERQARNQRLDPVEAPESVLDIAARETGGEIGDVVRAFNELPDINDVGRDLTGRKFASQWLMSVESYLSRLGDGATVLASLFRRRNELVDRIRAISFTKLSAQLERLTPDELAGGFQRFVEKGEVVDPARTPVLESVYSKLNEVDNWFYDSLKGQGVEVAPRVGAGTTNPTGRYFPHRFDFAALQDPRLAKVMIEEVKATARGANVELGDEQALEILAKQGFGTVTEARAVRSLMESAGRYGKELDRKDAERLLDTIIRRNTERISGNLERGREFQFDGYITDARRAYTATWARNAYRVADVAVLGRKDERVYRLLDQMRYTPDMPPSAHKFARDVYDLEVGRKRVQMGSLPRELYSVQGAKLSLSVLANTTQPLNTLMAVGLRPFAKAMGEALRNPRRFASFKGGTLAEQSGALPVAMYGSDASVRLANVVLGDVRENGMTAMLGSPREALPAAARTLARGADAFVGASLAAFRYVENFNRSISQRAGEIYFEQIAEQLGKRGEAGLTHRAIGGRLKELDLSPEHVLAAVRGQDTQALSEMRVLAGLRTSNETQFRSNYQSMPLWANSSEVGKFAGQFKNYAFGQAKFMMRELSPAAAKRDPQRFMRAVATVTLAYPAVGIALTSVRQGLMGSTLAGEELAERLNDPTVMNILAAGAIGMSMAGGLGIVADMGMTAAVGNDYALTRNFLPPVASSLINYATIFGSMGRAAVSGDPQELLTARSSALRELGGVGAAVEERLREREGRAEPVVDPIEAIFGASPFS